MSIKIQFDFPDIESAHRFIDIHGLTQGRTLLNANYSWVVRTLVNQEYVMYASEYKVRELLEVCERLAEAARGRIAKIDEEK